MMSFVPPFVARDRREAVGRRRLAVTPEIGAAKIQRGNSMRIMRHSRAFLLAGFASFIAVPAAAQTQPASDPAVVPAPQPATAGTARIYTPADFARFAPKNAYDMLVNVPGFSIRGASNERGLGQASENVLINGQRIANKSGGAIDELQKISASNVERIEIVDASTLGIAGLSGQVANVLIKAVKKSSGQFEWRPDFRAHYSKPNLFRGSVSYSGDKGPVNYTLSVKNQAGRGAYGGPVTIADPDGVIYENRHQVIHSESDLVTFSSKFGLDGPGSSKGNLTLSYTPYWAPYSNVERRVRTDGNDRTRSTKQVLDGWYYDINADYDFALGPGRLKLIGVRHFDHEPTVTTQITTFDSGADDIGDRFSRDARISETVGRAEYGWKTGKNDWQISLERAYNKLDQRGGRFFLNSEGEFEEIPFPEGSGTVDEIRYEGIGTFSRPLAKNLDLQIAGGGEISTLRRVDGNVPARKFFRPKGSVTLGWRPAKDWDASFKLRRRVGQISFYDFLSQPNLQQDRENSGNPDLVPPQSWEAETEIGHELGPWGKTRLKLYAHKIEDIIDIIPIGEDGESRGNIDKAHRFGVEWKGTWLFDKLGWKGAKLDLTLGIEKTSVKDPLTGDKRPISGSQDRWAEMSLRHDIPNSNFAWGASANYGHVTKTYFLTEIGRGWEGPVFADIFVENKNVMGLTVRAAVGNVLNARHRFDRVVYDGRRDTDPVLFTQRQNQLIGPIFSFMVKGNF